jgi:hypothetical protein
MVWVLGAVAVFVGSYAVVAVRVQAGKPAGRMEPVSPPTLRALETESRGLGLTTEYHIERPPSRMTVESGSPSAEHMTSRITEESGKEHVIRSSPDLELTAESLGVPVPPGAERSGARRLDSATGLLAAFPGARGVGYRVPQGAESAVAFYRDHPSRRFSVVESPLVAEAGLQMVEVSDRPEVMIGVESDPDGGAWIVILDISEPASHGALSADESRRETDR